MAYAPKERERIAAGLCKSCGEPRGEQGTSIRCRACAKAAAEKSMAVRRQRRENGGCLECGQPSTTNYCGGCTERRAARRGKRAARQAANGHCRDCASPRMEHTIYCQRHWAEKMARHTFGDSAYAAFLLELAERQGWRCHYTGAPLTPGKDMSIDHKIARAHPDYPGDFAIDNLAWTTKRLNLAKGDMSEAEFIAFCAAVLAGVDGGGCAPDEARTIHLRLAA